MSGRGSPRRSCRVCRTGSGSSTCAGIDKAQSHPDVPRLSDAQVELLDLIDELAHDPQLHLDMDFAPGDIQWLANRTILHSRTAYEDDPAAPRHLLRLWLTLHRNVADGSGLGGIPVKAR